MNWFTLSCTDRPTKRRPDDHAKNITLSRVDETALLGTQGLARSTFPTKAERIAFRLLLSLTRAQCMILFAPSLTIANNIMSQAASAAHHNGASTVSGMQLS
ncbi:hypothetical protein [Bradyrhizobium sp.]|uniref:hypothetical protein n=1 Tax=Bradyrhizobium sp. TaxID=376 RepID=UPI0039E45E2C